LVGRIPFSQQEMGPAKVKDQEKNDLIAADIGEEFLIAHGENLEAKEE